MKPVPANVPGDSSNETLRATLKVCNVMCELWRGRAKRRGDTEAYMGAVV